jgi:hypothetical protein
MQSRIINVSSFGTFPVQRPESDISLQPVIQNTGIQKYITLILKLLQNFKESEHLIKFFKI